MMSMVRYASSCQAESYVLDEATRPAFCIVVSSEFARGTHSRETVECREFLPRAPCACHASAVSLSAERPVSAPRIYRTLIQRAWG